MKGKIITPANFDANSQEALMGDPIALTTDGNVKLGEYTMNPEGDVFDDGDIDEGDAFGDIDEGDTFGEMGDIDDGDIDDGDPDFGDPVIDVADMWTGSTAGNTIKKRFTKRTITSKGRLKRSLRRGRAYSKAKKNYAHKRGLILATDRLKYFQVKGGSFISGPLVESTTYSADSLKYLLQTVMLQTPFSQIVTTASGAGSVTINNTNAAFWNQVGQSRLLIPMLIFRVGASALNNVPNSQITLDFVDGVGVAASPINWQGELFRSASGYDPQNVLTMSVSYKGSILFVIIPFKKVRDKVLPTLLEVNNIAGANLGGFQATISGLPAAATVSLIIPGGLSEPVNKLLKSMRAA